MGYIGSDPKTKESLLSLLSFSSDRITLETLLSFAAIDTLIQSAKQILKISLELLEIELSETSFKKSVMVSETVFCINMIEAFLKHALLYS